MTKQCVKDKGRIIRMEILDLNDAQDTENKTADEKKNADNNSSNFNGNERVWDWYCAHQRREFHGCDFKDLSFQRRQ